MQLFNIPMVHGYMDSGAGKRPILEYTVRRRMRARSRNVLTLIASLLAAVIAIPLIWSIVQPFVRQQEIVTSEQRLISRALPNDGPLLETNADAAAAIFLYRNDFRELKCEPKRADFVLPPITALRWMPSAVTTQNVAAITPGASPATEPSDELPGLDTVVVDLPPPAKDDTVLDPGEPQGASSVQSIDDAVQLLVDERKQAALVDAKSPAAAFSPVDLSMVLGSHFPTDAAGAIVFSHRLRTPRGALRWLIVTASWYADRLQGTYVLELKPLLLEPATMRPGSQLGAVKNYFPRVASFAVGPVPDFRVFAGQVDSASAFRIEYEIGHDRGVIAGSLLDDDSVSLLHASGPAYSIRGR